MTSPDRMEAQPAVTAHLHAAIRMVGADQSETDQWFLGQEVRALGHHERIQENRARISEIIAVLTEMQTDIARLGS